MKHLKTLNNKLGKKLYKRDEKIYLKVNGMMEISTKTMSFSKEFMKQK